MPHDSSSTPTEDRPDLAALRTAAAQRHAHGARRLTEALSRAEKDLMRSTIRLIGRHGAALRRRARISAAPEDRPSVPPPPRTWTDRLRDLAYRFLTLRAR